MSVLLNHLISAIIQLLVFTLIPFVFYSIKEKKIAGFLNFIGLYKTPVKPIRLAALTSLLFVFTGLALIYTSADIKDIFLSPSAVTGQLHGLGLNVTSIIILLLIAWIKTSLAEEIFFRGFISKMFVSRLGFNYGNAAQAVFFGFIHAILFYKIAHCGFFQLLFIFTFSTLAGGIIGYIKHKYANDSIVPGWIAHGLGNTLSYFIIAFVI